MHTTEIDRDTLEFVALSLSEYSTKIQSWANGEGNGRIELGESFQEWIADPQNFDRPEPTGRWHHQIRVGRRAVGYARSRETESSAWPVVELGTSPAVEAMDSSIDLLDAIRDDDREVRLLVVPAFQVSALWVVGDEGRADEFVLLHGNDALLEYRNRLLSAPTFFELLSSTGIVRGITFRNR